MKIIGITGASGAGKSTFVKLLSLSVVDADKAARTVTKKGHKCLEELAESFDKVQEGEDEAVDYFVNHSMHDAEQAWLDFEEKLSETETGQAILELIHLFEEATGIDLSGISDHKRVNEITREERRQLIRLIKNWEMTVIGTRSFKEAIITQGGVAVKEVNPSTMESRIIPGLFLAGEMLDIDALTGGYNIQLAWSTGYLAGSSLG